MDTEEAKTLGLDFKDVAALETSGINIDATKKLINGLIDQAQLKLEKTIKVEYDKKIKDIIADQARLLAKILPVMELTANGKSLPVAILDYIMGSDGIAVIIK